MSLICLYCDGPMPGPLAARVCLSCCPMGGDYVHHCTVDPKHGGTFGVDYCGQCRENAQRRERIRARNAPKLVQLREIRAQHVRDFRKPWPGAEFGKALVGRMIDGAIADLERENES